MEIPPVHWNKTASRFEIQIGEDLAVCDYRREGQTIFFTHTGVPPKFRGQGVAEKLVLTAFEKAKAEGWKIVPLCSYVVRQLERHPEFQSP